MDQNTILENAVHTKKEKIKSLESQLREKEQQYQFLVAEYRYENLEHFNNFKVNFLKDCLERQQQILNDHGFPKEIKLQWRNMRFFFDNFLIKYIYRK